MTVDHLSASYEECKRLNKLHGKTYYLATLLLPKEKQKYVHALYGFARYADEIVDDLASTLTDEEKAEHLQRWGQSVIADLRRGETNDLIGAALIDTVNTFNIPIHYFESFLESMTMDLTVTRYETFDDLQKYVYGSAVVIGLEMLPILGYSDERAIESASALGTAFQLANFIRDFGEDLERGRIYLPMQELAAYGVTEEMVLAKQLTPEIKAALAFQIDRVRALQSVADSGVHYLNPVSQPCIEAASTLYCGIVDEVEKIDYDVFHHRAKTSTWRRLRTAIPAFIRTLYAKFVLQ